jgi:hypothetical protein
MAGKITPQKRHFLTYCQNNQYIPKITTFLQVFEKKLKKF